MSVPAKSSPAHSRPRPTTGRPYLDTKLRDLVASAEVGACAPLVEEILCTALHMGRDGLSEADLKLISRSLKEMRQAARVFHQYKHRMKISIFGSARTPVEAPEARVAVEFARRMREAGYMIITGGGDGIMGAAQAGAGREESFGLNIRLPFEQRANPVIEGDQKLINFNYFFTRKLNFIKESHAVALLPGGFGTLDEGFESLTLMQTGKARLIPLVLLDRPGGTYWKTMMRFITDHLLRLELISPEDLNMFKICNDIDEAVDEVLQFYRVYHSSRYVGTQLVIRLKATLSPRAVAKLAEEFVDILDERGITQTQALEAEQNEPEILHLPRLVLTPDRRSFGRLRLLIDGINTSQTEVPVDVPRAKSNTALA
ncbi:MAG: LOG family protein [Verrucomicrobiia bacterium]